MLSHLRKFRREYHPLAAVSAYASLTEAFAVVPLLIPQGLYIRVPKFQQRPMTPEME